MTDKKQEDDGEYMNIPGIDGNVERVKRNFKVPMRVISGKDIIEYLKKNENWNEIQEMTTGEFVNKVVMRRITPQKPRYHDWLSERVAPIAVRKDDNNSSRGLGNESSSRQILNFKPTFFQKNKVGYYGVFRPDYNFISHVWGNPVKDLLGYLGSTILTNWTDVFSVAQLPGEGQREDLRNIAEAVYGAAEFKLMVDSDGTCFSRIWCLFEVSLRIRSGDTQIKFVVPEVYSLLNVFSFDELTLEERKLYWRESARILERVLAKGIDCVNAKATVEADRQRILNWIEKEIGIHQFNEQIVNLIKEEVMRLRMTAGGRPVFETWEETQDHLAGLREAANKRAERLKRA